MSWRCIKFASRSAIPSLNSANWASKTSSGLCWAAVLACCEFLSDVRDEGRNGVVGREGRRVRDAERERSLCATGTGVTEAIFVEFGLFVVSRRVPIEKSAMLVCALLVCALLVCAHCTGSQQYWTADGS
jgi:hypothetical protein